MFQVSGFKFQVPGSGFQVPSSKFQVPGSGFQVSSFGFVKFLIVTKIVGLRPFVSVLCYALPKLRRYTPFNKG